MESQIKDIVIYVKKFILTKLKYMEPTYWKIVILLWIISIEVLYLDSILKVPGILGLFIGCLIGQFAIQYLENHNLQI